VVNFTPRPLYPREKNPLYPLDRRLDGFQSRFERCGEEKNNSKLTPGIEHMDPDGPASNLDAHNNDDDDDYDNID
jgi:hypothetical protein